jgi:hypothetical protein
MLLATYTHGLHTPCINLGQSLLGSLDGAL